MIGTVFLLEFTVNALLKNILVPRNLRISNSFAYIETNKKSPPTNEVGRQVFL